MTCWAAAEVRDRGDGQRRQAAREILRKHGLEDVLGGGQVTVLDANLGVLEPAGGGMVSRSDLRSRHEAFSAELRRSMAQAREGTEVIARAKARRADEIARAAASRAAVSRSAPAGHPFCGCLACFEREERRGDVTRRQAGADALVAKGYSPRTAAEAYNLVYR
ncbi:MAG: hypothetical protein WBH47_14065 [Streptosporangiaceae bacterium]